MKTTAKFKKWLAEIGGRLKLTSRFLPEPPDIPPMPEPSEWLDSPSAVRKWGMWAMVKIETLDMRINLHAHKTDDSAEEDGRIREAAQTEQDTQACAEADIDFRGLKKDYHGHKLRKSIGRIDLRYPGYVCGDEKIDILMLLVSRTRGRCEDDIRALLRDLAPQRVVEIRYNCLTGEMPVWEVEEDQETIDDQCLDLIRIKLDENGEVPEVMLTNQQNVNTSQEHVKSADMSPIEALIAECKGDASCNTCISEDKETARSALARDRGGSEHVHRREARQ